MAKQQQNYRQRLLTVGWAALRLGLTSFGGPAAHLGYFYQEYVEKRQWLTAKLYSDLVALCQFLPGPASSQVGIAIGIYRAGWLGGVVAWLGFTLPSAVLLAAACLAFQEWTPQQLVWVHGLKLAAVAVVAQAVWSMGKTLAPDTPRITIAAAAAAVVLMVPGTAGQLAVIGGAGLLGLGLQRGKTSLEQDIHHFPISRRMGAAALFTLAGLLLVLPLAAGSWPHFWLKVTDSFLRIGALVFGGGHVVLPLLEQEVVASGWMEADRFLLGYGLAQAVPGPLFTFAAYVGAQLGGWGGATLATVVIFLPAFLLIMGTLPFWEIISRQRQLQSALWGINAAVVGLLLAALYNPVWQSTVKTNRDFGLVIVLFILLQVWRLPPWAVVLAACILTAAGSLV